MCVCLFMCLLLTSSHIHVHVLYLVYMSKVSRYYTIYNEKYVLDDHFSYNYSPCHHMRAWIHILDAPGCYERVARVERKSALQDSGLVRTVGLCAKRRVALTPQAIDLARDTYHERCKTPCILRGLLSRCYS